MASETKTQVWCDGNFKGIGFAGNAFITGGSVVLEEQPDIVMTFRQGEFGEADPEVAEALGRKTNNVEARYTEALSKECVEHGVVSEDGKRIMMATSWGLWDLTWISQEEAARLASEGDPVSCPPSHYELQPERQGRLVWLTGPPGSGKSTLAQLMSRQHGFVYYEGDCFFNTTNPYIPPDVENPTVAQVKQRKLVGEGVKERKEAGRACQKEMEAWVTGGEPDWGVLEAGFRMMCQDVASERRRMGGDWVVAGVLFNTRLRDIARAELGGDLFMVVLDIAEEEQLKRVKSRHGGDESMMELAKAMNSINSPAGKEEARTQSLEMDGSMGPQEVVDRVLKMESEMEK